MAYDFPDAPISGDEFTPDGGPTWRYSNGAWQQTTPAVDSITGSVNFDTMAQAQAAFIEEDVQTVRLNGYHSPGDLGAALYVRVEIEPTHAGKFPSADGAWWEIREAIYMPQMFGAKGDGSQDDFPAVNACIQMPGKGFDVSVDYPSGPTVFIPGGYYLMTSAGRFGIQLKQRTNISGEMTGLGNNFPGTTLRFPINCNGFTIHVRNTIDDITEPLPGTGSGAGSILEKLAIVGNFSGVDGGMYHGIRLRARAVLRDLWIRNFDGDGIHINAYALGTGDSFGNCNGFLIENCSVYFAGRHGIFVEGPDSNAGMVKLVNVSNNGRFGIFESSFLGNTYIACHAASNGMANAGQNGSFTPKHAAIIHYLGNCYVSATADETALVNTTPGTNEQVWQNVGARGPNPGYGEWAVGQPVGTYFYGGPYRTDTAAAANLFLGCYMEGGQASASFLGNTIVLGGTMSENPYTEGGWIRGFEGNRLVAQGAKAQIGSTYGGTQEQMVGGDAVNGTILSWDTIWRFQRNGADYMCSYANSSSLIPFEITGTATTKTMGTTTGKPYLFTARTLGLGAGNNIRRQTTGAAVPTTGEWAKGDIVWNINLTLNDGIGWVCIIGGTPGTWSPFGRTTGQLEITTDGAFWLSVNEPYNILHSGTLLGHRTVNVSPSLAKKGMGFRITRTGGGAYNLNVISNFGPAILKELATNTWCEVVYNGTDYYLAAYGTL